jgi:hypothetical protein
MSDPEKYLNADGDSDMPDFENSDNSYAKITQKLAKGTDTGMAKRRGRASGLAPADTVGGRGGDRDAGD